MSYARIWTRRNEIWSKRRTWTTEEREKSGAIVFFFFLGESGCVAKAVVSAAKRCGLTRFFVAVRAHEGLVML